MFDVAPLIECLEDVNRLCYGHADLDRDEHE